MIIKSFLLFDYFNRNWTHSDDMEGFHAGFGTNYWSSSLSKIGFSCIIVQLPTNEYLFYLKDDENEVHFMDYLPKGIVFRKNNISPEDALDICERQLDYYTQVDKLPTELEIKDCLYIFFDEGLYLSDIKYGYQYEKLSDLNSYDLVKYHRTYDCGKFMCVIFLNENNLNDVKIKEMVSDFKIMLEDIKSIDYNIEYYNDDRGLLLSLSVK